MTTYICICTNEIDHDSGEPRVIPPYAVMRAYLGLIAYCVQSILFILGSCGACVVSRVEVDGNFAQIGFAF